MAVSRGAAVMLIAAALHSASTTAQTVVELSLPAAGRGPRQIVAGPDGALWFTETDADRVGRIDRDGGVSELSLPKTGSQPVGIAVGSDGNLWIAEVEGNRIARLTTAGAFTEFELPSPGSGPRGIAAGPDGALWFTERDGNKIGRVTTAGTFTEFPIPTASSQPFGIVAGPDGALWFAEVNASQIGRIDPASHEVREFPVSGAASRPTFVAAGPDGNVWFTEVGASRIGRVTPAGVVTDFSLPSATSGPREIAAGPDGALWFTEHDSGRLGRMTTTGALTELSIPSPRGAPFGIARGPDGNLWFTEMAASQVGVVLLGQTTLTVPASASIHGAAGTFFHTDLCVMNRSFSRAATITATFRCFLGQSCPAASRRFTLAPRESRLFTDVVGTFLDAPGTAGAIELSYDASQGAVSATSRTYTPSSPDPTFGTAIPALGPSEAKKRTLFLGLASNAGDTRSGFRSNAGAYNPSDAAASLSFTLIAVDGKTLGTVSRAFSPREAYQINDVFAAAGAGSVVAANASLVVTSDVPVFAYVTVIDNLSGDSIFVPASDDEAPPP